MPGMELFATLAHEAYHNFFFRLAAAKDPSLLTAKPLEEKCARLFHAMVLKALASSGTGVQIGHGGQ